jgi:KipI family sensor histidine kinase inhibitor
VFNLMRQGIYLPFATMPDVAASQQALAAVAAMRQNLLYGITDIIPSYLNVFIEFDPKHLETGAVKTWAASYLKREYPVFCSAPVEIPTHYNGADLESVATQTGLTVPEVVKLHSSQTYHAFAVGFTPGFPFLGVLPDALRLPRRSSPRANVPAHSVAIAAAQTGVYPFSSPGGWHLLGTSGVAMYDPERQPPFWVQAGDAVRFVSTNAPHTPPPLKPQRLLRLEPSHPELRLEQAGLQTLLMDLGRNHVGHLGLAQSGALDPRSAARANALVGNPANAPVLELTLTGGVWTALRDVVLGFAGFGMSPSVGNQTIPPASSFCLRRGQTLRFTPSKTGVRGYLAIAGGFEAARFWGSASTDLKAGLGAPLRAGDLLGSATPKATRGGYSLSQPPLAPARVRLLKGAQPNLETLRALCSAPFVLERGDRMGLGLQLADSKLPMALSGGDVVSEATPLGAVQMTSSGGVLILLNDRGRTGGYQKPALVHPADVWRLGQVRVGESVQFYTQSKN